MRVVCTLFRRLKAGGLLFCILLCGCVSITTQKIETAHGDMPEHWLRQSPAGRQLAETNFWNRYQDQALSSLISTVLNQNNDIRVAALKIKSARISAGLAYSDRLPVPSVSAAASKSYALEDATHNSSFSVSGGLSYELDLWHKYAGAQQVARLEAGATEEDFLSAQLSLIGTTADLYWKIAYLKETATLAQESADAARQTQDIVTARWQAGGVTRADVITAQQNLLSSRETLQQNQQELIESWHALAVLVNSVPQENFIEVTPLQNVTVPSVATDLPANLIQNRPDLKAAEIRLRKLDQQIAVTRASYYPSFSLTGSLGSSSEHLREVLQNPLATIGASLALPFLEWQKMQLNIDQAKNAYSSALVSFRDSILNALGEVEDALSAGDHYAQLRQLQQTYLELAIEAERLAQIRYRAGAIDLQDWLDAQESLRSAHKSLNSNKLNQLNNSMTLCLALGGGDLRGADYVNRYAQN